MKRRDFLKRCGAAAVGVTGLGTECVQADRLTPKAKECIKQPFHLWNPPEGFHEKMFEMFANIGSK